MIHYFSGELWEEDFIRAKMPGKQITFHANSLAANSDLTDQNATILCTFIESSIGEAEMARFPALKLIATRSTGFDHIDLKAAQVRGITVVNVPSYGENTVAEFTFALLLALSRRIIDADERVRETGVFSPTGLRGFDLAGKTIGIIGCGHIGTHVIRIANGFGMKVIGFDPYQSKELSEALNFSYVALPELLASSEIISIHVPYNAHTHHLINQSNISSLKKGAYLINTARGAIIETQALVDALKNGTLAGAALDVLEEEGDLADEIAFLASPHPNEAKLKTILEDHYLINHPRVIVTPHLAFNTIEAIERILTTTIENILAFEAGAPINTVSTSV